MAIPSNFSTKYGIALMRQDPSGEWFFHGWASKPVAIADLGPGTHTFQLWLVLGNAQSTVQSILHDAPVGLYVMRARR